MEHQQRPATRSEQPSVVDEVLHTAGQPLGAEVRQPMEARFGQDFSRVRVHSDGKAAASASAVGANAYTVGPHIVFGPGQYRPGSAEGHRLLAHELTHVVQQRNAADTDAPATTDVDHPQERQAAEVALGAEPVAPVSVGRQVLARDVGDARKESPATILTRIQGLPMFRLLAALEELPGDVRSDAQAGQTVGGPRLVLAMHVVAAKDSGWEPFQARNKDELGKLPPDQVGDISAYLRSRYLPPKDIGPNWASRKREFLTSANDPSNALTSAQMHQIWYRYWQDEHAAARAAFAPIEAAEKRKFGDVKYAASVQQFKAGRRHFMSPEYEAAADRVSAVDYFASGVTEVLNWLEAQVDVSHARVTLDQINRMVPELLRRRAAQDMLWSGILALAGQPPRLGTPPVGVTESELGVESETLAEKEPPGQAEPAGQGPLRGVARDTSKGDIVVPLDGETPAEYAARTHDDWANATDSQKKSAIRQAPLDMQEAGLHQALRDTNGLFTHYLTEGGFEPIMLHQELRAGSGNGIHGHGTGVRAMGGPFNSGAPAVQKDVYLDFTVPNPPVEGNVERFSGEPAVMWHMHDGEMLPIEIQRVGYPNGAFARRGGSRGWVLDVPGAAAREVTLDELVKLGEYPR